MTNESNSKEWIRNIFIFASDGFSVVSYRVLSLLLSSLIIREARSFFAKINRAFLQIRGYMCFNQKRPSQTGLFFCISHLDKDFSIYKQSSTSECSYYELRVMLLIGAWYPSAPFWMSFLKCPFLKIKSSYNQVKLITRNNTSIKLHGILDIRTASLIIERVLGEFQINTKVWKIRFKAIKMFQNKQAISF